MNDEHNEKHWHGAGNRAIRWYFYAQQGLALMNEARYLFIAIFGAYFVLKLTNPAWMLLMFAVCIPSLIFLGWLKVHKMMKVMDWLGTQFASYWGRYSFDLQERQVRALEDINKKIKVGKNGKG